MSTKILRRRYRRPTAKQCAIHVSNKNTQLYNMFAKDLFVKKKLYSESKVMKKALRGDANTSRWL